MAGNRSEQKLVKIGEVVRRSGFSRRQLYGLLDMGLIREGARTVGGHLLFGPDVFRRLAIVRGLTARRYSLAEIRRTWKGLLRVVLAALVLWAVLPAGRPAAVAGEERAGLAPEDSAAIRDLFGRLGRMMTSGDARRVGGLLSEEVPAHRLARISEDLDAEFESRSYTEFECTFDEKRDVDTVSADRVRLSVLVRFRYSERPRNEVQHGDQDGQFWHCDLVRSAGGWRIVNFDYFDTLAPTQEWLFGRGFLFAALLIIWGAFWGWMFLDCCFRVMAVRKTLWLVLVGFPPGLGALVYFFAVWMRQGPED